jgi:hypothetical protein
MDTMTTDAGNERRLYRAGVILLVTGIIGLLIRAILVVKHQRYDGADLVVALGSGGAAIAGFSMIRRHRRG